MALLYITADAVGAPTGGGRVTREEHNALAELGMGQVYTVRPRGEHDPFEQDRSVLAQLQGLAKHTDPAPRLAHLYAGCFTQSVGYLKSVGYKVSYTVAAHDVNLSRKAHEEMGLPFPYPHLTDPVLFKSYTAGYVDLADLVIVPGRCALATVRKQGRTRRVEVVPHGCDFPYDISEPPPGHPLTVGYLGAAGPDKGLYTLARAFRRMLNGGAQGVRLLLGGKQSLHLLPLFKHLCGQAAPVLATGWVDDVTEFYGKLHLYVQPSATEGFGIEVPEAMAHGVPVVCSDAAGAADVVPAAWRFPAGDDKELAARIEAGLSCAVLKGGDPCWRRAWRDVAALHCRWEHVHTQYQALWRQLVGGR